MYAALVENGPAMTYVWSRKRGLTFISSNAEAITGYSKQEWQADFSELAGRQLEHADRATMAAGLESLQLHGQPMRATLRVWRRDGTVIWVDHHADCIER